jgi:ABC-type branched-subunit amino acid transport system substrate-binding protein
MARINLPRRLKNKSHTPVNKRSLDVNPQRRDRARNIFVRLSVLLWLSSIVAACAFPGSTAPVIKIGLVAPFEGRYRPIGYEAIYAARLAIREINAQGGLRGYRIELVALDDKGDPELAIEQARQLAIDPQVMAVIGHYRPNSTDEALAEYCDQQLPVIAIESAFPLPTACLNPLNAFVLGHASIEYWPPEQLTFVGNVPDPNGLSGAQSFVTTYNAIPIDGTRAGPIALQTYDAMYLTFDGLRRADTLDRAGVRAALALSDFEGLGAHYTFDAQGNLIDARTYIFQYDDKTGWPILKP